MKIIWQTLTLCLALGLSAGCSFSRDTHYSVAGVCRAQQADHVVDLMASKEDLSRISKPGYMLWRDTGRAANCFILTFSGKGIPMVVSSVTGTDQYDSESSQPMELAYISGSVAVLVPMQRIVTVSSPKAPPPPPGFIGFGKHELAIQYQLNGQPYSCHFDLDYTEKVTHGFHGFWELRDLN